MAAGNIDWLDLGTVACLAATIGLVAFAGPDIRDAFAEEFGDLPNLPEGVKIGGQQKPGGGAGERPATDAQGMVALHSERASNR